MQREEDRAVMHALHAAHEWSISRIATELDVDWLKLRRRSGRDEQAGPGAGPGAFVGPAWARRAWSRCRPVKAQRLSRNPALLTLRAAPVAMQHLLGHRVAFGHRMPTSPPLIHRSRAAKGLSPSRTTRGEGNESFSRKFVEASRALDMVQGAAVRFATNQGEAGVARGGFLWTMCEDPRRKGRGARLPLTPTHRAALWVPPITCITSRCSS